MKLCGVLAPGLQTLRVEELFNRQPLFTSTEQTNNIRSMKRQMMCMKGKKHYKCRM
jgi:hypothetical protein